MIWKYGNLFFQNINFLFFLEKQAMCRSGMDGNQPSTSNVANDNAYLSPNFEARIISYNSFTLKCFWLLQLFQIKYNTKYGRHVTVDRFGKPAIGEAGFKLFKKINNQIIFLFIHFFICFFQVIMAEKPLAWVPILPDSEIPIVCYNCRKTLDHSFINVVIHFSLNQKKTK